MEMKCPICKTKMDDEQHRLAERLGALSYLHLDIWVKCPNPKCRYTPAFGREIIDAKPVYWHPPNLPSKYKKQVRDAFKKHIPVGTCPFCEGDMELHKVWINTWKVADKEDWQGALFDGVGKVSKADQFFVQQKGKVVNYSLPSGILAQFKCKNWRCKYVRYVTL